MGAWNEISPAYELTPVPAPGHPHSPPPGERDHRLHVAVVFTSLNATIKALRRAVDLAARLRTCLTLVVVQTVPFPLPLASPPVLLDFSEKRLREIASGTPADIRVHLYLCRDRTEALKLALKPSSLVVLGGRKRWWPTAEWRLATKLRRAGHEVIFTEME